MKSKLVLLIQLLLAATFLGLTGCASKKPPPDSFVEVRLEEVDEGSVARAFGKVLRSGDGVINVKRLKANIIPGNPQASYAIWDVHTNYADPLRLEDSIIDGINMVLRAGGYVVINGVTFDFSPPEIEMLKGVRLIDSQKSNQLRYIVDRELARDRDFSGRLDPYKP